MTSCPAVPGLPSLPSLPSRRVLGSLGPAAQPWAKTARPEAAFGSYPQVSGLWLTSAWLGRQPEVPRKGRLRWKKPCWRDCPAAVQPGKEERVLPQVRGYWCVQIHQQWMWSSLSCRARRLFLLKREGVRVASQGTSLKGIVWSLIYGPHFFFFFFFAIYCNLGAFQKLR